MKNILMVAISSIFYILFTTGCMATLDTPKGQINQANLFAQSYSGIKPNNSTVRTISPCLNGKVIELKPDTFNYDEILDSEYRAGYIKVGDSTFEADKNYRAQRELEGFVKEIGACKAYWITHELIDPRTNIKNPKEYYGASYFAKIDVNSIVGFRAGEPSDEIKKEMDRYYGVEVRAIMPDSIASRVGLKEKDIILFINSNRCTYREYMQNNCGVSGRWSVVRLYRDGEVMNISM